MCVSEAAADKTPRTETEKAKAEDLPKHTLIYGGDFFCARRLNYALWARRDDERNAVFRDVAPLLRKADVAMINLEGMVSTGGYYNRLLDNSYTYRAHPRVLDILKNAGVDVVTIGNNHNGDYGPEAEVESTDHIRASGIEYTGAGVDWDDAARPVYRKVGDTVIAIQGMGMSYTGIYKAEKDRPGVHFFRKAFVNPEDDQALIDYLAGRVREARKHAHLVFFSPHWDGGAKPTRVTPTMRRFAKKLITEAGFDAVLAHGHHYLEGVEVFDGKPVLYDAGNSMADFDTRETDLAEQQRGQLWKVTFSKAGVHRVEAIPLHMLLLETYIAQGDQQRRALERVVRRSRKCDTELTIENGRACLDLDPGEVLEPTEGASAPKRPARSGIRRAPTDVLHERLPEGVTPLDVRYPEGIRLVGYELLSPALPEDKGVSETVVLYWTTDRPVKGNYVVHLDSRPVLDGKVQNNVIRTESHLPGDWMLPTFEWPVGKIIQDKTNLRMTFKKGIPDGVAFYTGLRKWQHENVSTLLAPKDAGKTTLYKKKYVPLGQVPIRKDAGTPAERYRLWRTTRKIELCPKQPFDAPPLNWPPKYGGE